MAAPSAEVLFRHSVPPHEREEVFDALNQRDLEEAPFPIPEPWDLANRPRFSKVDYLRDNWYLRLRDGNSECPKEHAQLMEKIIAEAETCADHEFLLPKKYLEKPEGFVDTNDPDDPRSDRYWEKMQDEYWQEASKELAEQLSATTTASLFLLRFQIISFFSSLGMLFSPARQLYKDYDAELQYIRDQKKVMDDLVPPFPDLNHSWEWEVHRRRKYYDKVAETNPLYDIDKTQADIFDPLYADFPLPPRQKPVEVASSTAPMMDETEREEPVGAGTASSAALENKKQQAPPADVASEDHE